ncbi:uroporphyrinogen-III C-methyltransferase [Chryseolinea sp. T2]|uniref:uroporphyrinogen-III C-methyltransferase n=1 Tax=Chryseolinea sp. T2 TaxID=3129255 RepID=UPI003077F725
MIPALFTSSHPAPRVTLVGAGPGDPELITVKAIKAIEAADIVLYDALVSAEILQLIPDTTPSLCVGKRAGMHSYKQEEINELIVEFAYLYGHVVRLKGGDPFVFGRGSEELSFAAEHGLKTAVVPGISSAISVPAAVNIPVTARGISESFWVVTGTTRDGEISNDVSLAARSTATIVILMGLNRLQAIMDKFLQEGRSDTPVAIVQNGTLPTQRVITGKVSNITALSHVADMSSPSVIVVGEVVNYLHNLNAITQEVIVHYQ